MDRLTQRLEDAARAVATLREILSEPPSIIVRDAAIKRFEYTFEATWKTAQSYLGREGFDVASPRSAVRTSLKAGLLDAEQTTVHLYREAVAEQIWEHIPRHAKLLSRWIDALRSRVENAD